MAEILYQGHASFRIITNSKLVIYVDPYAGEGYDIPADVLCVTHRHFDHYTEGLVPLKPDCTIITNEEAYTDGEYNAWEINDVVIEAVPAYNHHHPRGTGVGYVMQFDGRTVYFPGDTGITEEMKELTQQSRAPSAPGTVVPLPRGPGWPARSDSVGVLGTGSSPCS